MATPSVELYSGSPSMADYTPGADVTAGDVVVQGEMVGVALIDIDSDAVVTPAKDALAVFGGVFKFPKAVTTSDAITVGALCYWDDTNDIATTTASSHKKIGLCVEAAAYGDATVKILLGSRA